MSPALPLSSPHLLLPSSTALPYEPSSRFSLPMVPIIAHYSEWNRDARNNKPAASSQLATALICSYPLFSASLYPTSPPLGQNTTPRMGCMSSTWQGTRAAWHRQRHSHLLEATEPKESTQLCWVLLYFRGSQRPPGAMISHRTPAESNDLSFTGWLHEDITHSTAISHSTRMQGSNRALCAHRTDFKALKTPIICASPLHKAPLHSLFAQGGCPRDAPAAAHWAHFAFGIRSSYPGQCWRNHTS